MHRHFVLVMIGALLALPAAGGAQSPMQTERERERERIERERERAQEARDRQRDREREARERARERRDAERAERDRSRDQERRVRDAAGLLDTVVAFEARGSVTVSCPGGAVIVTSSDRNEIRVRARTESGAIRFTSSGSRATLEPAAGRGCSDGRFEVVVPAGSRVTANTWSGSISIRGVSGDIDAHAQSGEIEVRDAGGRLDAETLSGDLTVTSVAGDVSLQTISGDISLSGARGAVEVETVSGDSELRDVSAAQVRTHTTSGDVTFTGRIAANGRYEFNTHSGEVRLQLPADVGAQLSVSTFSGGIESAFPITLKAGEHGIGAAQAKRLNFSLGQGTARIVAETFSGDITLTSSARPR
jgi:DUF4097 and DUF4098 domain-containing protein YvlB